MEKAKKFFNENKKIILIIVVIVIAALIAGICIYNNKYSASAKEKQMENNLKDLGKDFYSYYYKTTGQNKDDREKFLESFSSIGLKVSLDSLTRYQNTLSKPKNYEFKDPKTGDDCDKTQTMVTIYPQKPYGKNDYKMSVRLVCKSEKKAKGTVAAKNSNTSNNSKKIISSKKNTSSKKSK